MVTYVGLKQLETDSVGDKNDMSTTSMQLTSFLDLLTVKPKL